MRAYLILPGCKDVKEVEYDGTPAGLTAIFPYTPMEIASINNMGDHLLYNPAAFTDGTHTKEGAWGVHCVECAKYHEYAGVCVLFGTYRSDIDTPQEPAYSARTYLEAIEWFGQGRAPEVAARPATEGVTSFNSVEELVDYLVGPRH